MVFDLLLVWCCLDYALLCDGAIVMLERSLWQELMGAFGMWLPYA